MAIYLQVRAGSLGILLDALRVHEVVFIGESVRADQAYAEWRGQVLPVVWLARHLQLPEGACEQAVVYSPDDGLPPLMLHVDEVARLRTLEPGQWSALPRVPSRTAEMFDAVYWDEDSREQFYRLRRRLEPALLGHAPDSQDLSAPAPT